MSTPPKINIDFLEFFKTGKFDYIKLGQTKESILSNFPAPEDRYPESWQKNGFDIWSYGSIEFHFKGQELFMIFSDHLEDFDGGEALRVDPWILSDASTLTLMSVMSELNANEIDFKKKTTTLGVLLRLQSGIDLTFENRDFVEDLSPNEYHMIAFALIEERPNHLGNLVNE